MINISAIWLLSSKSEQPVDELSRVICEVLVLQWGNDELNNFPKV